jgi:hypothetical protein
MKNRETYEQNFKKLSLEIIDVSMFYWGLYKELQARINKLKKTYPFKKYETALFKENKKLFGTLVLFGDIISKINLREPREGWIKLQEYLYYFQVFAFKKRKLLKSFLEELMIVNSFICNEWYRNHLIELGEKNIEQCEEFYFLSTELLILLESLADEDL